MNPAMDCGTVPDMASDSAALRAALIAFFERMKRERGISRAKLCGMADVSESTVREFINKQTDSVQFRTIEKLARAAGLTIDQMMGRTAVETVMVDHEKLHALLVGVGAVLERERIKLSPRQFADLVVAIYGIVAQDKTRPFEMSKEMERLILTYARRD